MNLSEAEREDPLGGKEESGMNHTKYRVWLISIVLAAVIFGIVWYVAGKEEENTITDGTLVYHELPGKEEVL